MALNWRQLSSRLVHNARSMRRPISASFELTSRCNLRCKMCYVAEAADNKKVRERELSAGQWIKLAEMAREAGVLYLTLTGGEVFLRKDIKEIYQAMTSMGFLIQIFTNGTLITPETAKWLAKTPPLLVSYTVYGASPETYERICGVREGYERVRNSIRLLREEGVNLEIKTTAVQGNWREFNEIAALAKEYGVIYGIVNYISPRREGCNSDPVGQRMTPEELIEHDALRIEYNKANHANNASVKNDEYDYLIPELEETEDDENDAFYCQAAKSGFWMTWDGRMTPCGLMNEPAAYPLEAGFEEAWKGLKKACSEISPCRECQKCDMKADCYFCPARLKLETGQYDKSAPYLCEIARLRRAQRKINDV